jgi:hypothetical protein
MQPPVVYLNGWGHPGFQLNACEFAVLVLGPLYEASVLYHDGTGQADVVVHSK